MRPPWQIYFMKMAVIAAERSTCLRRKVGAVLVRDNQIVSTGYNGGPKMLEHCETLGCLRTENNIPSGERHELCRAVHAEQNAIIQAALNGVTTKDAELYCTNHPCSICAKMIINAEIKAVYILEEYPDELARTLLKEAEIPLCKIELETGVITRL